jgi:putative ABC transport system permease protein
MRIDALVASGMSKDEARRKALEQFGDLEATRRYCRQQDQTREDEVQRTLLIQDFLQDVRISVRSLMRAPVLTLTIVATVGVGVGATAAIFSAINAALLRPLPYLEPDRLVRLYTDAPPFKFRFSVADYLELIERQTKFDKLATYTDRSMSYSSSDRAELIRTRVVSWQFFAALGITPSLGRDFSDADGRLGTPPVVIASRAFWEQRLGANGGIIGQPIRLDGADHTVIGVLPELSGPLERRQELFVIQQFQPPPRKGPFFYSVIGRLKPGADRAVAANELRAINKQMFPKWRVSYQDDRATWGMEDLKTNLVGDVSTIAGVAIGAVALVWLIACANASNLLIARVTSRRQELAVRSALGASRGRVIRYLLAESAVLAAGSMALGALVTWAGVRALHDIGATYFPRTAEISIDGAVIGVLAVLAAMSALLFGLVPALHAAGASGEELRSLGRITAGVGARRVRRVLVAAQFAIATPLLIAAALLLVSLNELRQVDIGFEGNRVVTGAVRLPGAQYREPARITAFWDELKRRLESQPGIEAVAFADGRPPNGAGQHNNFDLEQFPTGAGQSQPVTAWVGISPDYTRATGQRLIEGRLLDQRDLDAQAAAQNLLSVIVDQAWARRFFPNESALGKRFKSGGCTQCDWTSIVGVVSNVQFDGIDQPLQGTVYFAAASQPFRYVIARTKGDPSVEIATIGRVIRELEPAAPFSEVATVDQLVDRSLDRPQALSMLVASFAAVALLLSIVGIYGVMAYFVQQHLKEISIRIALGGSRGDVAKLVVGQGMLLVIAGVLVGTVTAYASTRLMSSLLFGVGAADPATFSGVATLMMTVALLACAMPAWRAMRVQPAVVLRNE